MQELTSTLFKPHTLVIIRLEDGQILQGIVSIAETGEIILNRPDKESILITEELLSRSTYCYTGFPSLREREEPIRIEGNSNIVAYDCDKGFGRISSNYVLLKSKSFVDPELEEMAGAGTLPGTAVLSVIPENQKTLPYYAAVIKASSLDHVIDVIASLAGEGKVFIAKAFCDLVLQQFPDDEDVVAFKMALAEATEKARGVNFYAPLPAATGKMLSAFGRIYSFSRKGGHEAGTIIDADSHKPLFFFADQLLGGLEYKKQEELIGQPVLYSIKKNTQGDCQARTILPPMPASQAYDIAENLYYAPAMNRQILTACDILRLILVQKSDFDYERSFSEWKEDSFVRDNLWKFESLPSYEGPEESLFLQNAKENSCVVSLERQADHALLVTDMSGTPDAPVIMTPAEVEELKASIPPPVVESPAPEEERIDAEAALNAEMEELARLKKEKKAASPEDELPSLEDCPDADAMIEANATITVRYRTGTLLVPGEERPYSFKIADIIDDELGLRAERLSTNIIQDYPVVCQLSKAERKANHICVPDTVLGLLTAADNAIRTARELDPSVDDARIYDLYDAAYGYAINVLDRFPANMVAIAYQTLAEGALKKLDDLYYRAPYNAVPPCGSVVALSNKKFSYKVQDPHFSDYILLPTDSFIDKDCAKLKKGDEIVYSVYPGGINKIPIARFACLARPAVDLMKIALQWENEGVYENAWGIAMNILDAEPDYADAKDMVERCEDKIDKYVAENRQRVLREDLFAQGQIAAADDNYQEAIVLFEKTLESQDDNIILKSRSVQRILQLYRALVIKNPDNRGHKQAYKESGEKYIMGMHGAQFTLPQDTLEDVDTIIQYYEDMKDSAGLLAAYLKKKELLVAASKKISKDALQMEKEERDAAIAQLDANIAWNKLLIGDNTATTGNYASWAKMGGNELGWICWGIVQFRVGSGEREIRNKVRYSPLQIENLEGQWIDEFRKKVYSRGVALSDITVERFGLLCAILYESNRQPDSTLILHYLWRYLATLTLSEKKYCQYVDASGSVPDDCSFVKQVFYCLQRGVSWLYWADIRQLCMLSKEAAYRICSVVYDLNPGMAINLFIRDGEKGMIYDDPQRTYFAQKFFNWCGENCQPRYQNFIAKANAVSRQPDLNKCIDYFRNLSFEPWMVSEDGDIISELHWQLTESLTDFKYAKDSRTILIKSRSITRSIDNWSSRIHSRPTVLKLCAFFNLLKTVQGVVAEKKESLTFNSPKPKASLVSASALGAGQSMYLEVEVRNDDKNAEPMLNCKLELLDKGDIIPDAYEPVVTYSDVERIYGGESVIYILHFKLASGVDIKEPKVYLGFEYENRAIKESVSFTIPFEVKTSYKEFLNDFSYGGVEKVRFYGREETIQKAVTTFMRPQEAPHYFIYGQKRSGKSSVLYQIRKQVEEKIPEAIAVSVDFISVTMTREEDIYYEMLYEICGRIQDICMELMEEPNPDMDLLPESVYEDPVREEMSFQLMVRRLTRLVSAMHRTRGWENKKLILFIDEFTNAYKWLIQGLIDKDFMSRWKNLQSCGLFGAVLIGQDVLHAFIDEVDGPNAFNVLEKERLEYLSLDEARQLVLDRFYGATGRKDIFIGNAVDRILYYSAGSAFYTKWICSHLVKQQNTRMLSYITEADVDDVIWHIMRTETNEELEKWVFDALIFSGISSEAESRFTKQQTKNVLDKVVEAELQDPEHGCSKTTLLLRSGESADLIEDLVARRVLKEEHEHYKLIVKMYNVWSQVRNNMNQ